MQIENPIVESIFTDYKQKKPPVGDDKLAEFRAALDLFYVVHDRYIWYSENSLDTSVEDLKQKLLIYQKYQKIIEGYYKKYKQSLLKEFILLAQFAWHWYEIVEAEEFLKRSAELWFFYNLPLKPARCDTVKQLSSFYLTPYPQMNYFYLGELYIVQGKKLAALQAFSKFIQLEPHFFPVLEFKLDPYFYYYNKELPSTLLAQEYLELLEITDRVDAQLIWRKFLVRD